MANNVVHFVDEHRYFAEAKESSTSSFSLNPKPQALNPKPRTFSKSARGGCRSEQLPEFSHLEVAMYVEAVMHDCTLVAESFAEAVLSIHSLRDLEHMARGSE